MRNYSVLMAVYHKEEPEYLRQAIESIQVQTVPTNDFVLVCDGPLNPELDAVIATKKQEMGNTLNVVRLAKNCGLGNALNEGIKHCKNELVARMDSDDIAYEEKKSELDTVTIKNETLRKYFPRNYTPRQMESIIIKLLDQWQLKKQQAKQKKQEEAR